MRIKYHEVLLVVAHSKRLELLEEIHMKRLGLMAAHERKLAPVITSNQSQKRKCDRRFLDCLCSHSQPHCSWVRKSHCGVRAVLLSMHQYGM